MPEFPGQTHAFFWREVRAIRQMGRDVVLFSTRRTPARDGEHAFAAEARAQTRYVFPPRWLDVLCCYRQNRDAWQDACGYLNSLTPRRGIRGRLRLRGLLWSAATLAAEANRRGIDHLHVHSCADAAHLAALSYRLGGPTYSLTLHGDLPVYGTDHAQKFADAVLVTPVTRALQEQVRESVGLDADRTPVVWMGVDTDKFRDAGRRAYEAGRLKLLSVSRLNVNKGHAYALRAVRCLLDEGLDIRYRIVGDGEHRDRVEREVARLRLADRVELTGSVSEDRVLAFMQEADCLVLPSVGLGEAAPVVVMEAMACGLPVIASIIGGTPEMIDDGVEGFLVPQADENALIDRMRTLANEPETRRRLAAAARNRAAALFDHRQMAGRLIEQIEMRLVGPHYRLTGPGRDGRVASTVAT